MSFALISLMMPKTYMYMYDHPGRREKAKEFYFHIYQ